MLLQNVIQTDRPKDNRSSEHV